jgi:hypothetical protein
MAPPNGTKSIVGWRSGASHCTSIVHDPKDADLKSDYIGFRVVAFVR